MLLRPHVAQARAASAAPIRRPLATHTFLGALAVRPEGPGTANGSKPSSCPDPTPARPPGSRGGCLVKISVAKSAYADALGEERASSRANARLHVP